MEHGIDSPILKKPHVATMLNCTMFSRKLDMILAGGSGANEVRAFDLRTGEIVATVSDIGKSILCMDYAKTKE